MGCGSGMWHSQCACCLLRGAAFAADGRPEELADGTLAAPALQPAAGSISADPHSKRPQ